MKFCFIENCYLKKTSASRQGTCILGTFWTSRLPLAFEWHTYFLYDGSDLEKVDTKTCCGGVRFRVFSLDSNVRKIIFLTFLVFVSFFLFYRLQNVLTLSGLWNLAGRLGSKSNSTVFIFKIQETKSVPKYFNIHWLFWFPHTGMRQIKQSNEDEHTCRNVFRGCCSRQHNPSITLRMSFWRTPISLFW